jgi:serine/threonine protein kinase
MLTYIQNSVRVVRKVINDRTRDNEEKVAWLLRDCNLQHSAILEILTMYRRGGNLEIIYPLAETDLNEFVTNMSYDTHWNTKDALANLLIEMTNLVSGLQYLHDGLENPIRRDGSVCHMDFKPDNILVFLRNEQSSHGNQGFIRFKISDFGIAKIRPKPGYKILFEQPDVLQTIPANVTENRISLAARDAGTYSAPEMEYNPNNVGLKSDVWSFACIFLKVLIRLVLRIDGLKEFDDARSAANDRSDFFFSDKSPSGGEELNAAVAAWLDRLSNPRDSFSVGMESKLRDRSHVRIPLKSPAHIRENLPIVLRAALKVTDTERCSSKMLYAALSEVLKQETGR